MVEVQGFEKINDAKASMAHIYNRTDPRAYFQELKDIGYTIPDGAKPVFQSLIPELKTEERESVCVLDVGCSYGVNAALLKYDLTFEDLCERWGQSVPSAAGPQELIDGDAEFFSRLEAADDIAVIGLDVAENAVAFAEEAGLLDLGIVADLEREPLSDRARADLTAVDLVTSTGCVGYVTEKSFRRLLPAVTSGRRAWFANFVLRMFPFDAIDETLREAGYVTEKLEDATFVQRAFATSDEQEKVLAQLEAMGLDPTGLEGDGHLHAEFYLSRPLEDAVAKPLQQLVQLP